MNLDEIKKRYEAGINADCDARCDLSSSSKLFSSYLLFKSDLSRLLPVDKISTRTFKFFKVVERMFILAAT